MDIRKDIDSWMNGWSDSPVDGSILGWRDEWVGCRTDG